MADIERGQRIRERREELHLTQPAVVDLMEELAWKLPRDHSLHPETAAEEKGKQRPQPPLTLRGLQTYEKGGGIVWEKAKLLAQVLRLDVQEMMSGEYDGETPDLSTPANGTDDRLARIEQALVEMREERARNVRDIQALLERQDGILQNIEEAIRREDEARRGADEATARLLAAADVATRAWRAETRTPVEGHEQPAT